MVTKFASHKNLTKRKLSFSDFIAVFSIFLFAFPHNWWYVLQESHHGSCGDFEWFWVTVNRGYYCHKKNCEGGPWIFIESWGPLEQLQNVLKKLLHHDLNGRSCSSNRMAKFQSKKAWQRVEKKFINSFPYIIFWEE